MTPGIHADSVLLRRIRALGKQVGKTPLYKPLRIFSNPRVELWLKLEWQQFSGSVKARAAYHIIRDAVLNGHITRKKGLLDASSGNTGIAYAALGAALKIPVTLCIPENISDAKRDLLEYHGAQVIYTSRFGTTDEAQEKAAELAAGDPDRYYYADQYANENNWLAHYYGTAREIWQQTGRRITHFVAGLGTTGTFTGTSRGLKELNRAIRVTALQPDSAMHGLEGWKHLDSAVVPLIYDDGMADDHLQIDTMEAYEIIRIAKDQEGLLLSPSSAASLAGALRVARSLEEGVVVTTLADHGSNYPELINELLN